MSLRPAIVAPCGCRAEEQRPCRGDCREADPPDGKDYHLPWEGWHPEPWCPTPGRCTLVLTTMVACSPEHGPNVQGIIDEAWWRDPRYAAFNDDPNTHRPGDRVWDRFEAVAFKKLSSEISITRPERSWRKEPR